MLPLMSRTSTTGIGLAVGAVKIVGSKLFMLCSPLSSSSGFFIKRNEKRDVSDVVVLPRREKPDSSLHRERATRAQKADIVGFHVGQEVGPGVVARDPDPDRHACSIPPFLQDSEGEDRSGDPGSSMVFREDFLGWSQAASSSLNSASGYWRIMVR